MSKKNEEENRQQSSVDRVNNIIAKTRDYADKAKKTKKAYQAIRGAQAGAEIASTAAEGASVAAEAAAAGSVEFWGPPLAIGVGIIILAVFLFTLFITILTGNNSANGGTPQDCNTIGGSCQATACQPPSTQDTTGATCNDPANPNNTICCVGPKTCASIGGTCSSDTSCASVPNTVVDTTVATCNDPANPLNKTCCVPKSNCDPNNPAISLKQNFNITAAGTSDKSLLKFICDVYVANMTPHAKYLSLFKSRNSTFTFYNSAGTGGSFAQTSGNGDVNFYEGFLLSGDTFKKYVLLHESGHVIAGAAPYLQTNLYNQTYNSGVDLPCFDSVGILKTYPTGVLAQFDLGTRINETYAESLADTLICTTTGICPGNGGGAQPISNFPNTCSFIYNYMVTNVL